MWHLVPCRDHVRNCLNRPKDSAAGDLQLLEQHIVRLEMGGESIVVRLSLRSLTA